MIKRRSITYGTFFLALVLGILIFAPAGKAATNPATFATQTYPLLGNTHIAADFNGDGRLDLAGSALNSAAVMLNNGNGTFGARVEYPVAGQTQDVAAGDFNGDGKTDLVVTINTPQISLSLLLGNGNGTFNAAVNFPNTSGFDSPDVAATDLNNDGKLDVVLMHSIACFTAPCVAAETISVMLGNGNGTFQPTRELAAAQHLHAMTPGDFNRDGIKDLAIGSENTKLHILLGVGDGTFAPQPAMTLIPGGDLFSASNDVDVADFNGDTIQDLVVALGNGRGNVVLLGNGDGTFRQSFRITENAVSSPLNLAVADFNLDGFQDIARAMGDGTFGLMEIANGNGDGTFQAPVRYLAPPSQSSIGGIFITASEFNGDGKPDVALMVGGASASLRVLVNTTSGSPPTPPNTSTPVATSTALATPTATAPGGTATPTPTPTASPTPVSTSAATATPTSQSPANTGFLSPSANAPVTTRSGDNNGYEVNPSRGHANDGLFAVDNDSGNNNSTSCTNSGKDRHHYYNFNISLPGGATVNGFEVRLDALADRTDKAPRLCAKLSWNGGATWTAAKQTANLTTNEATYILGGSADKWGRSWAAGELSNANFRVRLTAIADSNGRDFSLDWVAVKVYYQP